MATRIFYLTFSYEIFVQNGRCTLTFNVEQLVLNEHKGLKFRRLAWCGEQIYQLKILKLKLNM